MRNAVIYCLIFSLSAAIVMFFFANEFSVSFVGDERSALSLRILAISLPPIALSSAIGGYFVGVKRIGRNATVQVLGQIFKILITVFLILKLAS